MRAITASPQPAIARVHGVAGAVRRLPTSPCGPVAAAPGACFAVSGVNAGLFRSTPPAPPGRNKRCEYALRALLTGKFIDAGSARRFGMVNMAAPEKEPDAAVASPAGAADRAPAAVRPGKEMFSRRRDMSLAAACRLVAGRLARNPDSGDARAAADVSPEKGSPAWKSR